MPEFKTLSPIQSETPVYRPLPSRATQVAQVGDGPTELGHKIGEGQTGDLPTHAEGAGSEHAEHGNSSPLTHHPAIQFSYSGMAVIVLLSVWAILATRNLKKIPGGKGQSLAEMAVEGLTNFTRTSVGPGGERFVPLIGTLFLYILISNLTGAFPLIFKNEENKEVGTYFVGPMANISMTFALAFIVFCVVQYTAIKEQGLVNRLKHLAGPVWWLAWLIFPLEFIGELVRPMSLSIRLFGNIFGEEMIVAVLIGLLASLGPVAAILPFHLPIVLFGLLTAVVQAGVFCLLSCVYLQLAMEKHDDHGHEAHGQEGHHAAPAAAH